MGSGWDLLPGQDVGVQYREPDGDHVINVFRTPAADVRVDKWAEGSRQAMPGGAVVFGLRYLQRGRRRGGRRLPDRHAAGQHGLRHR